MPAEGKRDRSREAAPARLPELLPLRGERRGARLREAAAPLTPAPPRRERRGESKQVRRLVPVQRRGDRRVPAWRCRGSTPAPPLPGPAAAVPPLRVPFRPGLKWRGTREGRGCRGSRAPRGWMERWMAGRRSMRSALARPLPPLPPPSSRRAASNARGGRRGEEEELGGGVRESRAGKCALEGG